MKLHARLLRIRLGLLGLAWFGATLSAQETPRYYFSAYAGLASAGTRDGPVGTAHFNRPKGLVLDANGNIYVVDGSHTVRKIAANGVVSTVAGKPGDTTATDGPVAAARFFLAGGIAVNQAGTIYVTENSSIRQITPEGTVTTLAGLLTDDLSERRLQDGTGAQARFNSLAGLTIDAQGILYAGDTLNGAIRRITPAGVVTTLAGSGTRAIVDGVGASASFQYPHDLTIDPAGSLYVADGGNVVRKIEPGGRVITWAGNPDVEGSQDGVGPAASFRHLWSLAVDPSGTVYGAEGLGTIRLITPSAVVSPFAGDGIPGYADGIGPAASFAHPADLATDAAGNVYVADEFNHVIRKITPTGVVSTVAGVPPAHSRGAVDGPGATARFNEPRSIAVTADGVCYVADSANHVIRRIGADGTVSTFAGSVGQPGYVDGPGPAARFDYPDALAVDTSGNIFVIDSSNAVRKISPAGTVTTLAAAGAGVLTCIAVSPSGDVYVGASRTDGLSYPASVRRITPAGAVTTDLRVSSWPHSHYSSMAFDANGMLYVCDRTYSEVLRVTATATERIRVPVIDPTGIALDPVGRIVVSGNNGQVGRINLDGSGEILGGVAYQQVHHDGVGTDALFSSVTGIAVDAGGAIYVAGFDNTVRKGVVAAAPVISTQPQNLTVAAGAAASFSVTAAAVPAPTYQWFFNGLPITGATTSSYNVSVVRAGDAGDYHVVVTNTLGSVTSSKATLAVTPATSASPGTPGAGGSGGGAHSFWLMAILSALTAARHWRRGRQAIMAAGA